MKGSGLHATEGLPPDASSNSSRRKSEDRKLTGLLCAEGKRWMVVCLSREPQEAFVGDNAGPADHEAQSWPSSLIAHAINSIQVLARLSGVQMQSPKAQRPRRTEPRPRPRELPNQRINAPEQILISVTIPVRSALLPAPSAGILRRRKAINERGLEVLRASHRQPT
jgi:hypothetical protein